ncbi:MAG: flagellar biosynthesis anti-sigma factor FlgM [Helicobacteraceae bacterium]|jgi:anti-sigma28 factor (negative regulator of flagellin synthesis)|nr:flagellar biosynthesis anti-sigma factor FlgM [Helicobacteraceae bacterium]
MITPITQAQIGGAAALSIAKDSAKAQEVQKPQNRVEEIKKELEQGKYKFDLDKTAEKVAEALI